MKIFYITSCILDSSAVHTVHVDEICNNMAILGNDVTLYAPTILEAKIRKKYNIRFIKVFPWAVSLVFQIKLFFCLLIKHRPDIIYSRHHEFLFVPALIGKIFNIPTVIEANGQIIPELQKVNASMMVKVLLAFKFFQFTESFNVRSATKIIAVTQGVKKYLIDYYKILANKIEVVSNGVDVDFFKPTNSYEARSLVNLDRDFLYIGYVGSFYSWQGLFYIVKAAKTVLSQRLNIKFIIVGGGGEEDEIISFIKKEGLEKLIEIRPAVAHNMVPVYLNAFDICLCYPTRFRSGATSPFKVYEYLACAKPVVLADIDGVREEFGEVVVYAEPESSNALAEKIIKLVDDNEIRKTMGQRGRNFIEQGHSWKAVAEKIISICNLAIER